MNSSGMGRDVHSFMVSTISFADHGFTHPPMCADDVGEAVVACNMPAKYKFPSLNICRKRFLWTHKEVDLAPHPVVGVVLQVGITKKFSQTFCFESLDFFPVSKQDLCFTAIERMEVTRDLHNLNLLAKLMMLRRQILFTLAFAEAILMRISPEQVQSLHKAAPRYFRRVISSNPWPFMLTSALMLFLLLVMTTFGYDGYTCHDLKQK